MDKMNYARFFPLNLMKEPVQNDADARFRGQDGALILPLTIPGQDLLAPYCPLLTVAIRWVLSMHPQH